MPTDPAGNQPRERLFLAIWPDRAARDHARAAVESVASDNSPGRSVHWVPSERWHITMLFLGELPVRTHRRIRLIARTAATAAAPGPVTLAGSGSFGGAVWLGVSGGSWLGQLHQDLSALSDEHRPFTPHLTVGRSRRDRTATEVIRTRLSGYRGISWYPRDLALVRSHLGPHPHYQTIDRFRLGG